MKSEYKTGDRVVTNAKYQKVTGFKDPSRGVLVKQTGWQADVWQIKMDGYEKPQRVHDSMFEKEV